MNDYVGKICPYCKNKIQENDNIVVCSDCEMPHHTECWIENRACTTFGCQGTIKNADGTQSAVNAQTLQYESQPTPAAQKICPRCGMPNAHTSAFCYNCGTPMGAPAAPQQNYNPNPYAAPQQNYNPNPYSAPQQNYNPNPYSAPQQNYNPNAYSAPQQNYNSNAYTGAYGNQTMGGYTPDQETITLIGKNTEYYVPKFNEMTAQNKKTSWNWCACLFGSYWLFYRKMYVPGAVMLTYSLLMNIISSGFRDAQDMAVFGLFQGLLSIGIWVCMGLFGNYIYMKHIEKKKQEVYGLPEHTKMETLTNAGGVNGWLCLIPVGFSILMSIIFS